MSDNDPVLDLVGEIYDCAIQSENWLPTLERICKFVGAGCAGITLQDAISRDVRLVVSWGASKAFSDAMISAGNINPLMSAPWFVNLDEPFTTAGHMGKDEWTNCRFYKTVPEPYGYYDAAMSVLAKSGTRFGTVSLPFTSRDDAVIATIVAKLGLLAPHIRRAVTIADLLDARALQQDMLSATLDLLSVGIVLVDGDARIAHANRAGLALLDARAAIRRDGDHLSAREPRSAQGLKDAVKTVARGDSMSFPRTGIAVPIRGADGHDLAAWILPLDAGLRSELAAPFAARVAVFIRELGDTTAFPGELFVKRYGITPAECRVLMMLVQGLSVTETCDALGISEPTVKTHLSRLFAKTGTSGQADLMRLAVSALAPGQRPPN